MYIPPPGESTFTPVPAGTHLGICYRVIDLGTQPSNFAGETKHTHKVLLSWEIPEERMEDGRPFSISQSYTWSMHEKSNLRKVLEAWRGMAFQPRDFGPTGFDIKNILGKACTLSVVHTDGATGTVYANIASVGKPMKGVHIPERVNPMSYLWINSSRWDDKVFAELSQTLQNKIKASPEYAEMMGGHTAHAAPTRHHDDLDDSIPF